MSTSTTPNLNLIMDNSDEPVRTHHTHANANLAAIDTAVKSLQDSMANAVTLFGQLGLDANDSPVVSAATARSNLMDGMVWSDLEGTS